MPKYLSLLFLFLSACAAGPELADYPRREIDRPFNLPKGVASWSTIGHYSLEEYRHLSGEKDFDRRWLPAVPVIWRQNLSDRWNLLWAPIPVAAFYQIRSDESATTGLVLGYGLKISSNGYSTAALGVSYAHRQKLSEFFAIEFQPGVTPWFPLGEKANWDLQTSLAIGPFWQWTELFSVRGGVVPSLRRDRDTIISGNIFGPNGMDVSSHEQWRVVMPLYFEMKWSFARQWDFGGTLAYQKIGEREGHSQVTAGYEFRHFW